MDNNPTPKFDPETGRPLNPQPQPAEQPAPKFDPETGRPLTPPPAQPEPPKPRFDPETGRPLEQPAEPQPQRLDQNPTPGYISPQPGQDYTGGTAYTDSQPAPAKEPVNGLAVGSLICGLVSLICCCCGSLSLILGIVAVVLAILSKKNAPKMSGMALGGLICGIIGGGIALISVISGIIMGSSGILEDLFYEFSPNHGFADIGPGTDIYDFFG